MISIYLENLEKYTEILMDDDSYYGELKDAADKLFDMFEEISQMDGSAISCRTDHYLESGKAIGTYWAGRCLVEFMRTRKFLLGIRDGIRALQEKFSGEVIQIVYAGTGPFASLIIPLTTIFSSKEIQIVGLEINNESIQCLKRTIRLLNLDDYFKEIVNCDASKFKKSSNDKIHMIITETMLNGLQKEPQVAITQNLAPQLTIGGLLIPESIKITLNFVDYQAKMKRDFSELPQEESFYVEFSELLDLNKETCNKMDLFKNISLHKRKIYNKRFNDVELFTIIHVFGEHTINYNECSLTQPIRFKELKQSDLLNHEVMFEYIFGENPRFNYRIM